MVVVKPFGPHHFTICSASVQARHTSSRGALTVRSITISRSAFALLPAMSFSFLRGCLNTLEMSLQTIEPRLPEVAERFDPACDVLQSLGLEPARPELCRACARDEAGIGQHLEMLGDGRLAQLERRTQLLD